MGLRFATALPHLMGAPTFPLFQLSRCPLSLKLSYKSGDFLRRLFDSGTLKWGGRETAVTTIVGGVRVRGDR